MTTDEKKARRITDAIEADGVFRVRYGCGCRRCGFEWEYKAEERVVTS